MESIPGNPNPALVTLWLLILIQYGVIFGALGLVLLIVKLLPRSSRRSSQEKNPSSSSDLWFTDPVKHEELFSDFSPN